MPLVSNPMLTRVSRQHKLFSATLIVAIVTIIATALALACSGVYWATYESDEVSVERQVRAAHEAMESTIDELALQQETVALGTTPRSN